MKLPVAWAPSPLAPSPSQSTVTTAKSTKIGARINMSAEVAGQGLCPDCNDPMSPCVANDHIAHVCNPCRIVIPMSDAQLETHNNLFSI